MFILLDALDSVTSTELKAGGSLRPAWSAEWVPGQQGLQREALSWKIKNKGEWKWAYTINYTEKHLDE